MYLAIRTSRMRVTSRIVAAAFLGFLFDRIITSGVSCLDQMESKCSMS